MIIRINGGLGNQMFQYAFGKAMAHELNLNVLYDLNWLRTTHAHRKATNRKDELQAFCVQIKEVDPKSVTGFALRKSNWIKKTICWFLFTFRILHLLREKEEFAIDTFLKSRITKIAYIKGYFQTEDYFKAYEDEIRKDFTLAQPLSDSSLKYSQLITEHNAVSIHVRRGDYVHNQQINKFHGTCSNEYYQQAINYISTHVEYPVFFIFSDDLAWVKQQPWVSEINKVYVEGNTDTQSYEDMCLMSLCKHQIIANSSFSWWGGWLNQNACKIVIAPRKWLKQDNMNKKVKRLIPEEWIKM